MDMHKANGSNGFSSRHNGFGTQHMSDHHGRIFAEESGGTAKVNPLNLQAAEVKDRRPLGVRLAEAKNDVGILSRRVGDLVSEIETMRERHSEHVREMREENAETFKSMRDQLDTQAKATREATARAETAEGALGVTNMQIDGLKAALVNLTGAVAKVQIARTTARPRW